MKEITALVSRNRKLFFKDKGMLFSSMITPVILIVLYATFLANVYKDSFVSATKDMIDLSDKIINGTVAAQLAAALIAVRLCPTVKDYILVSHQGKEPAIKALLAELDKKAVIHAELALGEGTGAVMLFPLLDMAMQVYKENTTFDDIQITAYEDYGKC